MKTRSITLAFVAASIVFTAVAAARWRTTTIPNATPSNDVHRSAVRETDRMEDSIATAADLVATNDPFRLSNTAPSVRYDPALDGVVAPAAVAAQRPHLVLKAIVGGPPWQAVIDGIPGQPPGTIADEGKRFDKLLVRAVTRDSVIVQGSDTSWVLSFRNRS